MKAVIYTRIARDDGNSEASDRQLAECEAYAARHGYDVVEEITDNDVSAYARRKVRPGYDRLMQRVDEGAVDVVIAQDQTRLWRNMSQRAEALSQLQDRNVRLEFLHGQSIDFSQASDRMLAGILAATAAWESDQISERRSQGKRAADERKRVAATVAPEQVEKIARLKAELKQAQQELEERLAAKNE